MKKILAVVFLSLLWFQAAFAQSTNFGLTPVGVTQSISATTASSSITLNASPGNTVLIQNTGSNTAYIKGGATATTADLPLQPGWAILLNYPPGQVVSAITASSTTTLLVTKGLGNANISGSGSVVVSGTVTVAGNVSNATSAVATSSTNVPSAAYNYGFNGTTWDQLQVDASKNLKVVLAPVATGGLTPTTSAALAANTVIKASAGNLYSFEVSADATLSAAAWWIMIYNATSAPVDGAVTPLKCYAMPSGATAFAAAFPVPVAFSTGITIGVSTTGCFSKTASTHAFISGDAQ